MGKATAELKQPLIEFCDRIGRDSLLVQGAGGNVSWKDENTLFVKASGTWLSEAAQKDIFVPVDLEHMRAAIAADEFDVKPKVIGDSQLRPSIETSFHALLNHRVVVHLHSVEVISRAIRETWREELTEALGADIKWAPVPYRKPGAELARAVAAAVRQVGDADVLVLQNHGVVVGADTVEGVADLLNTVLDRLRLFPAVVPPVAVGDNEVAQMSAIGYEPCADIQLHALAQDETLAELVRSSWAITPDHVVFLGPEPVFVDEAAQARPSKYSVVFVKGVGVFTAVDISASRSQQLRCFYEVMTRQNPGSQIHSLATAEVHELLNWEAETYRMQLSK